MNRAPSSRPLSTVESVSVDAVAPNVRRMPAVASASVRFDLEAPLNVGVPAVVSVSESGVAVTPNVLRAPAVAIPSVRVDAVELFAVSLPALEVESVNVDPVDENAPSRPVVPTPVVNVDAVAPFAPNFPVVVTAERLARGRRPERLTRAGRRRCERVSAVDVVAFAVSFPVVPIDIVSADAVAANFVGRPAVVTVIDNGVVVAANFFGVPAVVIVAAVAKEDSPNHDVWTCAGATTLRTTGTAVSGPLAWPPTIVGWTTTLRSGNYSPHLAVTFKTVAVAEPIAVHHRTMLFVRSFGGITSSPPGSHVQMIPLPPEDAIAA
jgi:hypothetical protein